MSPVWGLFLLLLLFLAGMPVTYALGFFAVFIMRFSTGMFMETVSAITILTPIILPVAVAFGINPVHLGIIMVLNLMIGVISPPFGVVLFAINRVGEISFGRLVKALIPWFILLIVSLLIMRTI
ncbi:MAG: TRAP transporter large permease subunit [Lachnospiraceae bacterium]|nr:TRAP transporter large permease subunit [Lachnospiraceae bacterium]